MNIDRSSLSLIAASFLLFACTNELSPELQAKVDAGKPGPAQATNIAGGEYKVSVSANRKSAVVTPMAGAVFSIAALEGAAKAQTGCQAKTVANLYEMVGNDRNAPLPSSVLGMLGGAVPVILTCG